MNTLLEALADQMDTIVNGVFALGSGLVIWHLTNWSRDRADHQAELAAFRERADALIVAAIDVRASAAMNRHLWEHPWQVLRLVFMVACAGSGEAARVRAFGGTNRDMFAAGLGEAARLSLREAYASKTALAALREPMVRVHETAAPFLRHADERVVQATNELLEAVGDVNDAARVDAALAAFGRVVAAVAEPAPSRWARLRYRMSRRSNGTPQT
ncbi:MULTISPECIES: hypothetical protein [Streptomyces]|uniref:hypothetical protein n=1 Tax=Streptomyces TaxID=1883 RepID=UPI00240D6AA1|nr:MULTISPECIES: hypothetical protein [Streptomyces]WFB83762.1 hypothetical protein MMU79_10805 [Streptomyces olivaceus]WGK50620.1 hypothetical protein M6G09_36200 [Streptomyces sp. B146]